MIYGWEVSYPVQSGGKISGYLRVTQATSYSRVDRMLLESFYFRSGFNVRCIATPLDSNHSPGKFSFTALFRRLSFCRNKASFNELQQHK